MAQQIITKLLDDLDGSEASETIVFGLDGKTYEIDLNEKNAAKLRKALESYVDKGRKTSQARGGKRGVSTQTTTSSGDTALIRAWAKENGYEVNDRGRVPAEIKEAYAKAKVA
ncbi:histone-like nucleoid-structuring protein Lsr2 [Streptomyces scabiei]|uniref:histone-like nucleoid-structuring protein Lsr2 n=1 Tax=Streptomyces scabiei TaxID=1930 RepID=UPI001B32ED46|nr:MULTISPECIES: Lsr2 family protein [Streptomyces]MBP5895229.1 Lsr2 family protein [Streptomyces sp. LBUM 1481]MBP5925508.1 Lsr2 family protein [Streptomyces sp. LBUM 1483]MDX2684082.1 Lsr2 family protein [Streptomyces scabiei]MDX2748881.1 Lsr2 family protein [Streptomyces scabiei]MDX2803070.1 Lsr2 family protein [Streptomyces scabiei]